MPAIYCSSLCLVNSCCLFVCSPSETIVALHGHTALSPHSKLIFLLPCYYVHVQAWMNYLAIDPTIFHFRLVLQLQAKVVLIVSTFKISRMVYIMKDRVISFVDPLRIIFKVLEREFEIFVVNCIHNIGLGERVIGRKFCFFLQALRCSTWSFIYDINFYVFYNRI